MPRKPTKEPFTTVSHSPGDWKLESDGSVVIGGQVCISPSSAGPDDAPIEVKKANCVLIAAAPVLLAAAEEAHRLLTKMNSQVLHQPSSLSPIVLDLRAAIAKAKGGAA